MMRRLFGPLVGVLGFSVSLAASNLAAETILPFEIDSTARVDAMSLSGNIVLPIGTGLDFVPSTIAITQTPGTMSLVTTHLGGSIVLDDLGVTTIDLTVASTFSLHYDVTLQPAGGAGFDSEIDDPLVFSSNQPFEFTLEATATAALLDSGPPPVVTTSTTDPTGAFDLGTNTVSVDLGADLDGLGGNEVLTLNIDRVAVDDLRLGGVSIGAFSLDSDGSIIYDSSTFDAIAFLELDITGDPGFSFDAGSIDVSGSVNPDIDRVTLTGTFDTSTVVPIPPAAPLLGGALLVLMRLGRRKKLD